MRKGDVTRCEMHCQYMSDGKSDVFIEAIGVYVALVNVCIA